jgi:hypothetical protein
MSSHSRSNFDAAAKPSVLIITLCLGRDCTKVQNSELVSRMMTAEIWELINVTEDSAPLQSSPVRFQIFDRRPFYGLDYLANQRVRHTGPAVPLAPAEIRWNDTVSTDPGMVTNSLFHFNALPRVMCGTVIPGT